MGSTIVLENMSTVTDAEIVTWYDEIDYNLDLLSDLSGVETLKLNSSIFKQMMEGELPKCPRFLKLKKLTLGTDCMYCNFGLVSSFLKLCPNLVFLTLSHEHQYREGGHIQDEPSEDLLQIESFGCNRLKKLEILHASSDYHVDQLKELIFLSTLEMKDLQITAIQIYE